MLDACSVVTRFAEQPTVIHFFDETGPRLHVPDFLVEIGHHREFVEVKFEADVDEEVRARTARLTGLLEQHGWRYRLVTQTTVRAGYALENAQKLLRRGRQRPPEHWSLATYERIRRTSAITLGDFGWECSGGAEITWLCHDILMGKIHVDRSRPLGADNLLYIDREDMGGTLPWQA